MDKYSYRKFLLHVHLAILLLLSSAQSDAQTPTSIPEPGNYTNSTEKCRAIVESAVKCREGKPPLYLIAMAPYPHPGLPDSAQPSWRGGPVVIPGALLAAQHINCNSNILPDYQIRIIISDGGCHLGNRASANITAALYLTNQSDGNVVGIVGGACSESAFTVGKLVDRDRLSLVQIAPTATSPLFVQQKENYQNTVRLIVNALLFTKVFTEIIRRKSYQEIAILYDAERSYMVAVSTALQKAVNEINVTVSSNQPLFESYLREPLEELKDRNRLIFVFAGFEMAVNVLCIAYKMGMVYPDYQLVFINRRHSNFLKNVIVTNPDTKAVLFNCTENEMEEAVKTATLFEPQATREDKNTTIVSHLTYNEVECQYKEILQEHTQSLQLKASDLINTEYQNAYYDSTWALAMSLSNSQPLVNLSTYRYGQPNKTKIILQQFFDLSFEGATGKVQFSEETLDTQDVAVVNIFQQLNNGNESEIVANFSSQTNLTLTPKAFFLKESTFKTPLIYPPIELGYLAIAVAILVGIGIGVIHYLNGGLGDIKLVKATSWQLNHLIFSGCYLLILDVIVYSCLSTIFVANSTPDPPDAVLFGVFCNVQVWLSTYSFSLIFGTICMKTWRIWRIFSHFSSNPIKFAADYVIIFTVLFLVVIDTVYLLIWTSVDPLVMHVNGSTSKIVICRGDNLQVWLPILLVYKAVVLLIVLYFSISTRKVNKLEFKQTKSINTLVYILLFVTTLGLAPYAIVTASQTFEFGSIVTAFVFYSGAFVLMAIICTIFVFLPPIYPALLRKWKRCRLLCL